MALNGVIELFTDNRQKKDEDKGLFIEELYQEIGQLKVELWTMSLLRDSLIQ